MHWNARMGRPTKRTRVTARKTAAIKITVRPEMKSDGEYTWLTYCVQGWKEDGKWQRRRFKDEKDAERFAALKRIEMENKGRAQRMVLSPLTDSQHEEALQAFDRLGGTYTLEQAVSFFLRHHRPPEFTIRLNDAVKLYLDDKERDGLRPRTIHGIGWTLGLFSTASDNPFVHEVTAPQVESFLRGLRAKNGHDKATRRSWEIHRGALHGFFAWSATPDTGTNRPFTFANPVEGIRKFTARQVREEQNAKPATTSPADVRRLLSVLMRWRGGVLVRSYALLYFAGLRPDELKRLAGREAELVNLRTRTITIPANVSKTRHERQIVISANLAEWLAAFPGPLVMRNFENLNKRVRKRFAITHDEARHSFISYHVAAYRSIGDAALQAGNSENVVKRHYLNTHTREEGEEFFRIVPDATSRRAVLSKPAKRQKTHLKAV
jgi:hypothetical protein